MKKTLRLISLLLACMTLLPCFASCRKKGDPPIEPSDKKVIMTLGGYNVTYDFYRFLFLGNKAIMDGGDDSYWEKNPSAEEELKQNVLDALKDVYAYFALADEYKIELGDEEKESVKDNISTEKASYKSEDEFKADLAENNLTEELFRFTLEAQELEYLVYAHVISESSAIIKADDTQIANAVMTDFVRADNILFTFKNDEEKAKQENFAKQVLEALKNGSDFDTLKKQYSEDSYTRTSSEGYCFTHGEYKNDFEDAAFKLEDGQYSDIVLTNEGFHIIKRLPIDKDYIDRNFEDLRHSYLTASYYKIKADKAASLEVEYKDLYNTVSVKDLK